MTHAHSARLLTPTELRSRPALLDEMRAAGGGTPDGFAAELRMAGTPAEVRAATDQGWKGGGLAVVYDKRSENLGGFVEEIRAGALTDVLARDGLDVRALFNHDPAIVLGRTKSGTLSLTDGSDGLDYEFDAPDTSAARDLRVLLERGDVSQSSFAFRAAPDGVEWDEDPETGVLVRRIHRFSALLDVSPVTYPAYPAATSGIRSSAPPWEFSSAPDVEFTPVEESAAPDGREGHDSDEARKARARAYARRRRLDLRQRHPR